MQFKDIPRWATIQTPCGQRYTKLTSRTIAAAPGHSHYETLEGRRFYAGQNEEFTVVEAEHATA
jgi:hypothetical protein